MQPRKKILFIDSAKDTAQIVKDGLMNHGYQVSHFSKSKAALESCRESSPDVVVCEAQAPGLDGLAVFRDLRRIPDLKSVPFVLMASFKEVDERIEWMGTGIDDYVQRPVQVDELAARIEILLKEVELGMAHAKSASRGFTGNLAEMNVIDLIQTLEVGKKTGLIRLKSRGREGVIFVINGDVVDAVVENLSPEKAIIRMLTWLEGSFVVEMRNVNRSRNLEIDNNSLFVEGAKRISRFEQISHDFPSMDAVLCPTAPGQDASDLPQEAQDLLGSIDGKHRIWDVIESGQHDELRTFELLRELYEKGFVKEGKVSEAEERASRVDQRVQPAGGNQIAGVLSTVFKRSPETAQIRQERRNARRRNSDRRHKDRRTGLSPTNRIRAQVCLNKSELIQIKRKFQH